MILVGIERDKEADLGMGTTLASFQEEGKRQLERDKLKRFAREDEMVAAVKINIQTETPSGPFALEGSMEQIK